MESLLKAVEKEKESCNIIMVNAMTEIGNQTNAMDEAMNCLPMEAYIKETTFKIKCTDKESILGLVVKFTRVSGKII